MSDDVMACPECDTHRLYTRSRSMSSSQADGRKYRCMACGWEGDTPKRRSTKQKGGQPSDENTGSSALAAALLDADPDEVSGT